MATVDTSDAVRTASPSPTGYLPPIARAFGALRRRIEERRIVVRLSRMDPHLIRDMGLDPEAIHNALDGSWDETTRPQFPKV